MIYMMAVGSPAGEYVLKGLVMHAQVQMLDRDHLLISMGPPDVSLNRDMGNSASHSYCLLVWSLPQARILMMKSNKLSQRQQCLNRPSFVPFRISARDYIVHRQA